MAARSVATTIRSVHHGTEPASGSDTRPEWLLDLLAEGPGPYAASTWAWRHRWLDIPTRFVDVLALAAQHSLSEADLLQLTRAAARRIHFAFALRTLEEFTHAALLRFPEDDLLRVLALASTVSATEGGAAWAALEQCVREAPAEGIADHVMLTAVYLADGAPRDVLERSLALADGLAARGDLVALYRTVSILRRLGRYEESLDAGMKVNDAIVSGDHPATFREHLSERVLVERHLVVELLAGRLAAVTEAQQGPSATGL